LHADEKRIRMQSAISYKTHKASGVNNNRVFLTDALFIRQKKRLARASAQWLLLACDGIHVVV
jgi:hypothetical protein